MTAEPMRSPLEHRVDDLARLVEQTGGAVTLVEIPFLTQLDLRVDATIAAERGLQLPFEPNKVFRDGVQGTLWLGPDEWLVTGPGDATHAIRSELEAALGGTHHSIVDVGANRAMLDLGGLRAREVLSSGCGLDLHPTRWRPAMCAQTLFANAQVILEQLDEHTTRIYVRPSFADYLVDRIAELRDRVELSVREAASSRIAHGR